VAVLAARRRHYRGQSPPAVTMIGLVLILLGYEQ
jgi:xanthosine utilization system XapX-like protein